jgi:hypothetical protein
VPHFSLFSRRLRRREKKKKYFGDNSLDRDVPRTPAKGRGPLHSRLQIGYEEHFLAPEKFGMTHTQTLSEAPQVLRSQDAGLTSSIEFFEPTFDTYQAA